jgi:hypothetical protein
MDPVVAGAVAPPPAAAPSPVPGEPQPGALGASAALAPPPTEGAPPQPGAEAPVAAALPPQPATPPGPPEPDYKAILAQQQQELAAHRAFAEQFQAALAQAQAQQAEAERAQQAQSRLDAATALAQNLAPEDGYAHLKRVYDAELARERQEKAQIAAQQQQAALAQQEQMRQAIERMTAPVYAKHLQQTHGLPPEYEQRLAAYGDGHVMDRVLPGLKAEWQTRQADAQKIAALQAQLDQFSRSVQAQALAQSGAHVASGVGVAPAAPLPAGVEKGSDAHLNALLRAAGW